MGDGASVKPRVVAIIQARMGSTRLPGKVLKPIAGQPLLWHIVHRLRRSRTIDEIVIATSDNARDAAIMAFGAHENIKVIRGPEENVLARFDLAAKETGADIIVRVSSDAPFIDAGFVDHLVEALIAQDGDYVLLQPGSLCAHEGVDPFSRRALNRLVAEAADDAVAREHVTGYFKVHPDFARIVYASEYKKLAHEGARLTIDTPDDLAFVETIHQRMHAKAGEASLSDLLLLLEREPALVKINAHVRQKTLAGPQGGLAVIRCDGGGALGYGHVKRTLSLAKALRDRESIGVVVALNGEEAALAPFIDAGFETAFLKNESQSRGLARLIAARGPDMLICDARENLSRAALAKFAKEVGILAVIDDGSERRLAATHAYYPPVPQTAELDWRGSHCRVRVGWEWAVLGFDSATYARLKSATPADRMRIVVSMGGSDPLGLTRMAAQALAKISAPFDARFIIGPGFHRGDALAKELETMKPNFRTVSGVSDLGDEFAGADLALVAFGVTAYELAALGVPALYLALTHDHALSASAFEDAGMGKVIGPVHDLRAETIAHDVWSLINDEERRRDMRASARAHIDGHGAERIASDLAKALAASRTKAVAV